MAVLSFVGVCYTYPGQTKPALDGCTLQLPRGQRIALIGPNGSGKSTFFLHCNGILKPQAGHILLDREPIRYDGTALKAVRQRVGVVFQNADDQLFSANITEDISFGPLNLGLDAAEVCKRVDDVSHQCGLAHLLARPIHTLSGGEKARVALAGVLAMRPDVLLVDEPTASLDPPMRRQIFQIFEQLHQRGTTVVLATHEYEVARYWADYVIVMNAGRVLTAGATEDVFRQQSLLEPLGLHQPWYTSLHSKR